MKALQLTAATLLLFLSGCSAWKNVYERVEPDIAQGEYLSAIQTLRENQTAYGEKSSVLYRLEMGLLFHYAGMPDSSTRYLLLAEKEMEDLYTKSISAAAVSMLVNDNVLPFEGEDYEKVLVNIFLALNFVEKGDPDGALVEARKVDLKLREMSKKYEGKNRYQQDAFSRYLSGALYEHDRETNDAFISYRLAYEAYQSYAREYGTPTPSFLLDDLVRTATLMSFTEEARQFEEAGGKPYSSDQKSRGSVLVIVYAGRGPIKEQIRPSVSIPDDEGTIHTFQIALPRFVVRQRLPRAYDVKVWTFGNPSFEAEARAEVVEDVNAIAAKALEDRLGLIYLKSGGRALLKFLAAEKAKNELKKSESQVTNILSSLAVDLIVGATEQADLRVWRSLPAHIQLARLSLEPGDYSLTVWSSDGGYRLPETKVRVKPGEVAIVIADDLR